MFNASRVAQSIDQSVSTGSALQLSQKADMMHDAVRADVLQAMLGSVAKESTQMSQAQGALQEHAGTFQSALTQLQALPLSPQVRAIIGNTLPLVNDYTQAAAAVQAQLAKSAAPDKALSEFQALFLALEKQMALQSEAIEKLKAAGNACGNCSPCARLVALEWLSLSSSSKLISPSTPSIKHESALLIGKVVPLLNSSRLRLLISLEPSPSTIISSSSSILSTVRTVSIQPHWHTGPWQGHRHDLHVLSLFALLSPSNFRVAYWSAFICESRLTPWMATSCVLHIQRK